MVISVSLTAMVVTPEAGAATVGVTSIPPCDRYACEADFVQYAAHAGEANDLVVTEEAGAYRFEDTGAPLSAGPGCTQIDANRAVCAVRPRVRNSVDVDLGDGADRAVLAPGVRTADAGPGDDVVSADGGRVEGGEGNDRIGGGPVGEAFDGGPGADVLAGGGGDDRLGGGPGADTLLGGDDDDTLTETASSDAPREPDVLDGGPGSDRAAYGGDASVLVDLRRENGNGPSREDVIRAVEGGTGGAGGDVLIGNDEANHLAGGCGDDRILGLGGNDVLDGSCGADHLDAGTGDDRVYVPDRPVIRGERDRIACGTGHDTVQQSDFGDLLARDCERMFFFYGSMPTKPVRAGRTVGFRIPCATSSPLGARQHRCRVRLTLELHGRPIGRRTALIRAGRLTTVRVRLSRRHLAGVRRAGRITAIVRGLSGNYAYRRRAGFTARL